MITLQEFINMYKPEVDRDIKIMLLTNIKIGNIERTIKLGIYAFTNGKCSEEIDMNRLLVESFTIPSSSDYDIQICVSDNNSLLYRNDDKFPALRESFSLLKHGKE